MSITIALAGNPNCGKTTLFNNLTGSAQYVGNWPGVTVEKKEGWLRGGHNNVIIQDLPGIYSLSPYTPEEVAAREYLVHNKPDVILNIVDGSNIERNLYLTTQLLELGIPVLVAVNMMDAVRKNGDKIDFSGLSRALGCEVVEMSAIQGLGTMEAAEKALALAQTAAPVTRVWAEGIERVLQGIEHALPQGIPPDNARWYAVKIFERDPKVWEELNLDPATAHHLEGLIKECEAIMDDDAESIVISQRYAFIGAVAGKCVRKGRAHGELSPSDKIDAVVTNRWLAMPIFAAIMFVVYYISVSTVGDYLTGFTNDTLFGEWILPLTQEGLESFGVAAWLISLIVDGIIGGVGAVLGFVPQMLVLFLLLSMLEDCGYMARAAFIMDRIFRRFGLSGKSFIPMLIGSGCSVPGIMASRTIERERDRRMTIMTTSFIPCGAKMPVVALIAGALFGGAWWVAPVAYFIGVAAVIISGILLKKLSMFAGDPSPFVMELPTYHVPTAANVLRSAGERGMSFIRRAGTVILLASIVIWFLSSFSLHNGSLAMTEDMDKSVLASIGSVIAPIFSPLGFGDWQPTVATLMGLVAKEEVVGVFGVLYGVTGDAMEMVEAGALEGLSPIAAQFTALSAFSFLVFNLLCAPCFAAMGAIRREMNSARWTWFAIGYLSVFAYAVTLMIYQFGLFISGGGFTLGTAVASLMLIIMVWLLVRPESRPCVAGIAKVQASHA